MRILICSLEKEMKTKILRFPFWLNILETFFSNKYKKLVKQKLVHLSNIE